MSVIVEAIEGVVDAVNEYIIEPIKNDPLTFIATIAGAAFLGPGAAAMFGTNAAVGMGIGAAIGNTGAGLAQGESFDEAIKGGALAGVTTFAGASISSALSSTPLDDALASGASIADDSISALGNSQVAALNPIDDLALNSIDDAALSSIDDGAAAAWGKSVGNASQNLAQNSADDIFQSAHEGFANTANTVNPNLRPDGTFGNADMLNPQYNSSSSALSKTAADSVYTPKTYDVLEDVVAPKASTAAADAGLKYNRYPDILNDTNLNLPSNPNVIDGQGLKLGTDPNMYGLNSPSSINSLPKGYLDTALEYGGKGMDYLSKAGDWVMDHPYYTAAGVLGLQALTNKNKPNNNGGGGGGNGQIGDANFYESLPQYAMDRRRQDVDLTNYGIDTGEGKFFSDTVYVPVKYADGGYVDNVNNQFNTAPPMDQQQGMQGMGSAPAMQPQMQPAMQPVMQPPMQQPAQQTQNGGDYGYYTYGQIPATMQGLARGGLSTLASGGQPYARGGESFDGRSDDIPAVLSDGEFVMDAETVALLGNGSSKAGADRLEQMRQAVRKQKGGALAKGKFSPNAKSPLAYLKNRG